MSVIFVQFDTLSASV